MKTTGSPATRSRTRSSSRRKEETVRPGLAAKISLSNSGVNQHVIAHSPHQAIVQSPEKVENTSITKRAIILLCVVTVVIAGLWYYVRQAPSLDRGDADDDNPCKSITLRYLVGVITPAWLGGNGDGIQGIRGIWSCASRLSEVAPLYAGILLALFYVALQTFAIPGPLVLSIVAGALYGPWWSQLFIACCATLGASLCYGLSATVAWPLLQRYAADRVAQLRKKVEDHRGNLFWYMLFLRITPACPNWLVNLASPVAGVPFSVFFSATALGLLPANFFHAHTGATLASMNASEGLQDNKAAIITLVVLQGAALIPTLIQRFLVKEKAA